MPKHILITEKPSVAMEFAKVLGISGQRKDGYIESDNWIITWCVGHLVTMSYTEKYDEKMKERDQDNFLTEEEGMNIYESLLIKAEKDVRNHIKVKY